MRQSPINTAVHCLCMVLRYQAFSVPPPLPQTHTHTPLADFAMMSSLSLCFIWKSIPECLLMRPANHPPTQPLIVFHLENSARLFTQGPPWSVWNGSCGGVGRKMKKKIIMKKPARVDGDAVQTTGEREAGEEEEKKVEGWGGVEDIMELKHNGLSSAKRRARKNL